MTTQKKKKKYDWIKLKNEYLTTNISLRGLAEKHGIPFSTVNSHSSKESWGKQKPEIQNKISTEVEQKTIDSEIARKVKINENHIQLYEDGLGIVKDILEAYKKTMQSGSKRKVNPFNLEKIFSCIEKAQKGQRIALNIDEEKPEDKEPEVHVVEGLDFKKI